MKKKLAVALSCSAALVLTLTGCGDDAAESDAWAKKVCDKVKPQVDKIQQANASINEASQQEQSPKKVQKVDSAAFQDISDAYAALARAVDDAGTPPVEDGQKLEKNAVKELKNLSKAYGDLKTTVDGLETGNQSKFAEGLKSVAQKLGKLGESGDESLQKLQSGALGEAMAGQPGCRKASPGTTPGA
ncbi:small secreted protein [Streptomyces sp. TR06-5]|uniref:small secreted protein n=1 Tax=unclassified Streptomyces TaxID=2593676 RepID=UPI0039A2325A